MSQQNSEEGTRSKHLKSTSRSFDGSRSSSENGAWAIWKRHKAISAEEPFYYLSSNYFSLHREGRISEDNKNCIRKCLPKINDIERIANQKCPETNLKYQQQWPRRKTQLDKQVFAQNVTRNSKRVFDYSSSSFKRLSVESIYSPKHVNKLKEDKSKKKKCIFSKHNLQSEPIKDSENGKEEQKQKVSFSGYAQLNDRIEKLEALLNNEHDLSDQLSDLIRMKSESLADGHPSWQEATYNPIPDPVAFHSPSRGIRRPQIDTEILQYCVVYGIITILGVFLVALTGFWVYKYNGGLFDMMNLHILFSMIGFLFLSTQGILSYRTTRYVVKDGSQEILRKANIVHTIVHTISVAISCMSIAMAFLSGSLTGSTSDNKYSLHSWIGVFTFIFYCLLWLFSFLYYFPQFTANINLSSIHFALGMTCFLMIISSCLSGFMEVAIWSLQDLYSELPPAAVLVNCIGVLIMVYCGFVIYTVQTVKEA